MKKSTLTCVIFIFSISYYLSQTTSSHLVYFDSDQSDLRKTEIATLDNLKKDLINHSDFEITLVGHTDQDGTSDYNQNLAHQRTLKVKDYLLSCGVLDEQVHMSWQGENKLATRDDSPDGKQLNRRVEIVATTYDFEKPEDLINSIHQVQLQEYTEDNSKPISIACTDGTNINIKANAFEFTDGSGSVNSNITFEIKEAVTYEDFISEGLFTHSKGEILETGGMMYINASVDGKEVKLKEGYDMEVIYPLQKTKEGMELFYASSDENGNLDWTATNEPIQSSNIDMKELYANLDIDKILNFDFGKLEKPELDLEPLRWRPRVDDTPYPPAKPEQGFPEEYVKYEKMYADYLIAAKEHKVKKPKQIADLEKWNREVDERLLKIWTYKMDLRDFHAKFQTMVGLKKARELKGQYNKKQILDMLRSRLNTGLNLIIDDRDLYQKALGNYTRDILMARRIYTKQTDYSEFKIHSLLGSTINKMVNEAKAKAAELLYEKTGKIGENDLNSYVAKVNQLGWINCDRFINFPSRTNLLIADQEKGTQYYLIFEDIKSMLGARQRSGFATFENVPKNAKVKIMGIKLVDNKPYIAIKNHTISDEKFIQMDFQPGSLTQIKQELKKLEDNS